SSTGGAAPINTIESAPVNTDGSLGKFSPYGNSLVGPRLDSPILIGNYLYYLPDFGSGPTIERPSIYGGIQTAVADTRHPLGMPGRNMSATIHGNYAYLFGGEAPISNAVVRASIAPDGTLGDFSAAGLPQFSGSTPPNVGRSQAAAVVLSNTIYLWGGL